MTRPQPRSVSITVEDALDDVARLTRSFEILEDGPVVTETLIALCRAIPMGGKQPHDANIVATMLAYGTRRLLTFNTADFRRYGDRIEFVDNSAELATIADEDASQTLLDARVSAGRQPDLSVFFPLRQSRTKRELSDPTGRP